MHLAFILLVVHSEEARPIGLSFADLLRCASFGFFLVQLKEKQQNFGLHSGFLGYPRLLVRQSRGMIYVRQAQTRVGIRNDATVSVSTLNSSSGYLSRLMWKTQKWLSQLYH